MSVKKPGIVKVSDSSDRVQQAAVVPEPPKVSKLSDINPDSFSTIVDYAASRAETVRGTSQSPDGDSYALFFSTIEELLSGVEGSTNLACFVSTLGYSVPFVYSAETLFGNMLFHVGQPGNNHIYIACLSVN